MQLKKPINGQEHAYYINWLYLLVIAVPSYFDVCGQFLTFTHPPFIFERVSMAEQGLAWQECLEIKLLQERIWLEQRLEEVRWSFLKELSNCTLDVMNKMYILHMYFDIDYE